MTTASEDPSITWKSDEKEYNQGPDQIFPSTAISTCHADGAVKFSSLGSGEISERQPMSVPSLLHRAAQRSPERIALAVKRHGDWVKWTYKEYLQDARTVAKGFIALGLEKCHSVCILGCNTPEWMISDLAAIFAGGFASDVYTTNSPEACTFVARDSRANIFVVEDELQLKKILEVRDSLPHLKAIIQYTGEPVDIPNVYSWSQLLSLGVKQPDSILDERLSQIAINQCCTLIYTSGTTGNPKGVMLSHDNMTWLARVIAQVGNFKDAEEEYVSFLPLSHAAGQIADIYIAITCSASIYFGDKNALKGTLIETMREVRPTKFCAVPRVWEKMYEKMQEIWRSTTGIKKWIGTWAKGKGMEYNMTRMRDGDHPESLGFQIADKLVLGKVRDALGLGRCDLLLSGAAPISPEILKYFWSLNLLVTELYGMSECNGPHCMGIPSAFRLGSVGKSLMGVSTRIDNPDGDGNGEICMGGRHVMMGYLNQPDMTRSAIDDHGWLQSEDIGRMDQDGHLYITGRIKEILITAGGENVAPVPIENCVKAAIPLVSQAMLLGDKRKFLSVLITLKTEVDKETQEPLDILVNSTKEWIEEKGGCTVETVQDVINELYDKIIESYFQPFKPELMKPTKKPFPKHRRFKSGTCSQKTFPLQEVNLGRR